MIAHCPNIGQRLCRTDTQNREAESISYSFFNKMNWRVVCMQLTGMMRKLLLRGGLLATAMAGLHATTLQQLSLNDMIQLSTAIVQGQATLTGSSFRGSIIYTHYQIQVSEVFKGSPATELDVAVLGGSAQGLRQDYAGSPTLTNGQNYVLFLWTSKSGLTQVIGLSQGLFTVVANASGQTMAVRPASAQRMLSSTGQPVSDSDIMMSLSDLGKRVKSVLSGGGK